MSRPSEAVSLRKVAWCVAHEQPAGPDAYACCPDPRKPYAGSRPGCEIRDFWLVPTNGSEESYDRD